MEPAPTPAASGPSVSSYRNDFPFMILRWVSLAAAVALMLLALIDASNESWMAFAVDLGLLLAVVFAVARPSWTLGRAGVMVDAEGIRRRGAWSLTWGEIRSASVESHRDIAYVVVLPREPRAGTDLTRAFIRGSEFPKGALCSPLDGHRAPDIRDAIDHYLR